MQSRVKQGFVYMRYWCFIWLLLKCLFCVPWVCSHYIFWPWPCIPPMDYFVRFNSQPAVVLNLSAMRGNIGSIDNDNTCTCESYSNENSQTPALEPVCLFNCIQHHCVPIKGSLNWGLSLQDIEPYLIVFALSNKHWELPQLHNVNWNQYATNLRCKYKQGLR